MTHVEGFDNLDEMFASMAVHEDMANLSLTPGQTSLRDDVAETRYWAHALPEIDLIVFGVTPPIADILKSDPGFDVEDNRSRGYLTGTGYSADMPNGEPGDTHVSQVVPISAETFALARDLGWPTWTMLHEPDQRPLGRALAQHEADALCRV